MGKEKLQKLGNSMSDLKKIKETFPQKVQEKENTKTSYKESIEVGGHVFKIGDKIGDSVIKQITTGKNIAMKVENQKGTVGTITLKEVKPVGKIIKTTWQIKKNDITFDIELPNKDYKEPIKSNEEQRTVSVASKAVPVVKKIPEKKEEQGVFSFQIAPDGPTKEFKINEKFTVSELVSKKDEPKKVELVEYRVIGSRIFKKKNIPLLQCEIIKDGKVIKQTEFDERRLKHFFNKGYLNFINPEENFSKELKEWREKTESTNESKKPALTKRKEIEEKENEENIEKIIKILKNNKISEVIVNAGNKKIDGEHVPTFTQDLDSRGALFLLNDFNKKSLEEIYAKRDPKSSIIDIRNGELEPKEKTKGTRIFIDAGGTWLKVEKDGKTTTVRIDHHGSGKKDPTSGTKMMYDIMNRANLLKEKPEWLGKFVNFVNEFDNLTYLENTDKNKKKTFNETYFKEQWPNSLYAIAEKIPFNTLLELVKSGKIKDPSMSFTDEELKGELGKTKIGELTIAKLCEKARIGDKEKGVKNIDGAEKTIEGIKNAKRYAEQEKLNLDNTLLGKVVYHNFGKIKPKNGKEFGIKINNKLAFIGTKALGYDTYINWNKEGGNFFINSNHPRLSEIVEKLNKEDPECAVDIRGVMVYGKIKNLTEEKFLKIIKGEEILKIVKPKKTGELKNALSPQEILDTMEEVYEKESYQEEVTEAKKEKIQEIEKQIVELMKEMPKKDLEENKTFYNNFLKITNDEEIKEFINKNLEKIKKVEKLQKQLETIERPISNEILETIARKIINVNKLSEEEEKMREENINEISKILEKIANKGSVNKEPEIKEINL